MKQSIIVFLLFLILVAIYRIYTLKQREGFQTTASCPMNVTSKDELVNLVQNKRYNCLENLDVSKVQDMTNIFNGATYFNQDISNWDVSGATDMKTMFAGAYAFNQDISDWNVSSVKSMNGIFSDARSFNQPLNNWYVSGVKSMEYMFYSAISFNQDISDWDVSGVKNMSYMFGYAIPFNQDISGWNVSGVQDMQGMFIDATSFNQPLNDWDVSGVKSMHGMFYEATSFNQPLKDWVVRGATDMTAMFSGAEAFNQPLNNWDVGSVIYITSIFYGATSFNQPLNNWDVSGVQDMQGMFFLATSFNQPLNNWVVSGVKSMHGMFANATAFNQDISNWDVSGVTDFTDMFKGSGLEKDTKKTNLKKILCSWEELIKDNQTNTTGLKSLRKEMTKRFGGRALPNCCPKKVDTKDKLRELVKYKIYTCLENLDVSKVQNMESIFSGAKTFNQPLNWDVSGVKSMVGMFAYAEAFNQDISNWEVRGVTNFNYMFNGSGLAKDTEKTNLIKIYCSWKNKVTDRGKSTFETEIKRALGGTLPNCVYASLTTRRPFTTTAALRHHHGTTTAGRTTTRAVTTAAPRHHHGTTSAGRNTTGRAYQYQQIYTNYECLPNGVNDEVNLGKQTSLDECANACKERAGKEGEECKWFIYGKEDKAGQCWWEKKCDRLQKDRYNVYEMNNNDGRTRKCPKEYPILDWYDAQNLRFCYTEDKKRNRKGLVACTHGDTFKNDGWGTFDEGGGEDHVEKCQLKREGIYASPHINLCRDEDINCEDTIKVCYNNETTRASGPCVTASVGAWAKKSGFVQLETRGIGCVNDPSHCPIYLVDANLKNANLSYANLENANLENANLENANLKNANLSYATLFGANLSGANLSGANLENANLYGDNLYGANLSGANLSGANLYGANLYGANLSGANLYGAILSGAKLDDNLRNIAQKGGAIMSDDNVVVELPSRNRSSLPVLPIMSPSLPP